MPKARQACFASNTSYTYNMYILNILQKSIHPEDGSTFLEVLATRSYASSGTHHSQSVAQRVASLLPLLQEQITALAKVVSSLKEACKDDETEAAGDAVARYDVAMDWACHDIEETQDVIQDILRDVAGLFSPPEI